MATAVSAPTDLHIRLGECHRLYMHRLAAPHGPYKLNAETRAEICEMLRSGLTLREAAKRTGVTVSGVDRFCQRDEAGESFRSELVEARRVGQPVRGARAGALSCAAKRQRTGTSSAVLEVGGMRINCQRAGVAVWEAAFLLGMSVTGARKRLRTVSRPEKVGDGVDVVRLAGMLELAGESLALVLLARLAEGRLDLPRPQSDSAVPVSHIVVLRGLS